MNEAGRVHRKLAGSLVAATHNAGKLREFRELLGPWRIALVSAGDLGLPEPEETGDTFEANAKLKAFAAARAANMPLAIEPLQRVVHEETDIENRQFGDARDLLVAESVLEAQPHRLLLLRGQPVNRPLHRHADE